MDRQITYLRIASSLLDLLLLLTTFLIVGYPLTLLMQAVIPSVFLTYLFWRVWLIAVIGLFLVRDRIGSPGKRAFGIKVLHETGKPITLGQSIIRNLFLLIPLLNIYEVYRFLFQKKRRLGDIVARTIFLEE